MATSSPLGHGQIRSFRMPANYWLRRAERCREHSQPLRAVTLLRHAMQLEPEDADLRLEYASELHGLGCYESSCRECYTLLARRPSCFAAFGLLAQDLLALGQPGEAADAYAFYAQYANMFPGELPQWDDDLYYVEDTLAAMPPPQGRLRLGALLKAAGQRLERGDLPRAKALLVRAGQKPFPKKMPQRSALWALYCRRAGQPRLARTHARRAIQLAPLTCSLLAPMAMLLFECKDPAAAPALLRAAITARTPEDRRSVCLVAAESGYDALAVSMLERVLKREPSHMQAAFDLCVFRLRAGDLASASALIHRLREIDPEDPSVEILFGEVSRLCQTGAAPEAVRQSGRQQPFFGVADARLTGRALSCFYTALTGGVEAFAAALPQDPRQYAAFLSLLQLDEQLGNLLPSICAALPRQEAVILLRRALLLGLEDQAMLRVFCHLLVGYGYPPPFLVRTGGHLSLLDPSAQPPPTPSFLQRMLYRRLRAACRAYGSRELLPFGLHVISRLTPPQQRCMAGDKSHVWPLALAMEYARLRRRPFFRPGAGADPENTCALKKARLAIHQALNRRENDHGTH